MRTEREIKQAQRMVEASIARIHMELTELEARRDAARNKKDGLPDEASLRAERQAAIVRGEDVSGLTKQISNIRELSELYQDEITGLAGAISRKQEALAGALEEQKALWLEMTLTNGRALIDEYNSLAEKLGKVLGKIYAYQNEYSSAGGHGYYFKLPQNLGDSAITRIPKLFMQDEEVPVDHMKRMFWDKYCMHLYVDQGMTVL